RPVLGDDRDRDADAPVGAVELQHHLLEPALALDDQLDLLDDEVPLREVLAEVGHVCPERLLALDAPADGVVQLRLPRERPDERIGIAHEDAVVVGHGRELFRPLPVQQRLLRGTAEQLREPRHRGRVAHPAAVIPHPPEAPRRLRLTAPRPRQRLAANRDREGGAMRTDVEFDAKGVTLRGWHYVPDGARGPVPTIVMAHGFSAVKEMYL